MGRRSVLASTPLGYRWVVVATVSKGQNGWTQISGGVVFLPFWTSVGSIPGHNHTGIVVLDENATASEGDGSVGVVGNDPRDPPTQRTPRSQKPVGNGGSLSGQFPNSWTPGQQGPYPGSGSAPTPGLVSGPRLTVAGIPK